MLLALHASASCCNHALILLILCTILLLSSVSCHRRDAPRCLPGAALGTGMLCPSAHTEDQAIYRIPFRDGVTTRVSQSYHDNPTHHDEQSFAIDFECEPGEPIVAARDGVVWRLREDSFTSCADAACLGQDNFVILDHGDGTHAGYHHLAPQGAIVSPGEQVCRGQVIGLCGATGFATAPHLHFNLTALWNQSLPAPFLEPQAQRRSPYPITQTSYRSQNTRRIGCPPTPYSSLSTEAFSHRGILLDEPLPTHFAMPHTPQRIRGTYLGQEPRVALHVRAEQSDGWLTICAERDAEGRFELLLDWGADTAHDTFYWIMITGSDAQCQGSRWAWSYSVFVEGLARSIDLSAPELNAPPDRDALRLP